MAASDPCRTGACRCLVFHHFFGLEGIGSVWWLQIWCISATRPSSSSILRTLPGRLAWALQFKARMSVLAWHVRSLTPLKSRGARKSHHALVSCGSIESPPRISQLIASSSSTLCTVVPTPAAQAEVPPPQVTLPPRHPYTSGSNSYGMERSKTSVEASVGSFKDRRAMFDKPAGLRGPAVPTPAGVVPGSKAPSSKSSMMMFSSTTSPPPPLPFKKPASLDLRDSRSGKSSFLSSDAATGRPAASPAGVSQGALVLHGRALARPLEHLQVALWNPLQKRLILLRMMPQLLFLNGLVSAPETARQSVRDTVGSPWQTACALSALAVFAWNAQQSTQLLDPTTAWRRSPPSQRIRGGASKLLWASRVAAAVPGSTNSPRYRPQ